MDPLSGNEATRISRDSKKKKIKLFFDGLIFLAGFCAALMNEGLVFISSAEMIPFSESR